MSVIVFVTGGTFDKEYNEITGELYFKDTHVREILDLGRKKFSMREVLFSARKNKTLYGLKSKQNIFHIGNVSDLKMINELDF